VELEKVLNKVGFELKTYTHACELGSGLGFKLSLGLLLNNIFGYLIFFYQLKFELYPLFFPAH
jgi:hypothetical protein